MRVPEHMTNLESLTVNMPNEHARLLWYAFHPKATPEHLLLYQMSFPDHVVALNSVKSLAIPPTMDWLRDRCPNVEKIAHYKPGQHRSTLKYKSIAECPLTSEQLQDVYIHSYREWETANKGSARIEPCLKHLHKTRKLSINIYMLQQKGCVFREDPPPQDLPSRLARVLRAMTGLEEVHVTLPQTHEVLFENAFKDSIGGDEGARDETLWDWVRRVRRRSLCPRDEEVETGMCSGVWMGFLTLMRSSTRSCELP